MYVPSLNNSIKAQTILFAKRRFARKSVVENTVAQERTNLQLKALKPDGNSCASKSFARTETSSSSREVMAVCNEVVAYFKRQSQLVSLHQLLDDFDHFFIHHDPDQVPIEMCHSVYQIAVLFRTPDLVYLIHRCAFLLVNVCLEQKKPQYITRLIRLFEDRKVLAIDAAHATHKFRDGARNYMMGQEYLALQSFDLNHVLQLKHWRDRYLAIALTAQAFNPDTIPEQRQASQLLSRVLKHRYRFQLVMFLTKGIDVAAQEKPVPNPTFMNPTTLKLLQKVVVNRGISYEAIAKKFRSETAQLSYGEFKDALSRYLLLSLTGDRRLKWLPGKLEPYLLGLETRKDNIQVGEHLITKTCNSLINYLLKPANLKDPSHPFTLLMMQGENLSLSILLLKLVLLSPRSYGTLMQALDELIRNYADQEEAECEWLISLVETMQVILTLGMKESQNFSFPTTVKATV
jgi:hypothetical protein